MGQIEAKTLQATRRASSAARTAEHPQLAKFLRSLDRLLGAHLDTAESVTAGLGRPS